MTIVINAVIVIARTTDSVVCWGFFFFFLFILTLSIALQNNMCSKSLLYQLPKVRLQWKTPTIEKMKQLKMHAHRHSHNVYVISSTFNIYVHAHFAFIGCISLLISGRSCTNTIRYSLSRFLNCRQFLCKTHRRCLQYLHWFRLQRSVIRQHKQQQQLRCNWTNRAAVSRERKKRSMEKENCIGVRFFFLSLASA